MCTQVQYKMPEGIFDIPLEYRDKKIGTEKK
jgi:hypothetical protein